MAISNFLSTVWAKRVNESLKNNLVYGNCVNTDYEGEIREQGQTVKIGSVGAVTIGIYNKTNGIGAPEELTDSVVSLVIDQANYFNFRVDDIDKAQSNADIMDAALKEASFKLSNEVDKYIAGLYAGVKEGNTIGDDTTPIVPTKDNAYDYLVDLGVILDEANVPEMDRFVVVPSWFYGLLLKDARFTKDANILATGYVGDVDGMKVYKSSNVPNTEGAKYKIMAGYKGAIAFANQISNVESFRPEVYFSDAVKGLNLYGAKVIKPEGIAILTVSKK